MGKKESINLELHKDEIKKTSKLFFELLQINTISPVLAINTLIPLIVTLLQQQKIPVEEVDRIFDGLKNMYKQSREP